MSLFEVAHDACGLILLGNVIVLCIVTVAWATGFNNLARFVRFYNDLASIVKKYQKDASAYPEWTLLSIFAPLTTGALLGFGRLFRSAVQTFIPYRAG